MKIQKILFSSSEEYCDFWEPISKIFYEHFGIESVLIFFGDKNKYNLSEKYGTIITPPILSYPMRIQLLWSRIWYSKLEPNTTWLLGDIDLFPLQKTRFVDMISHISDDYHVHLAHNKISNPPTLWKKCGPKHGGADLTSHYHVAKGSVFDKNFDLHDTFEEACRFLYESKQYGLGFFSEHFNNDEWRYHCCCEHLTTEKIRTKLNDIKFIGIDYLYEQGINRPNATYDVNLLKSGWYIDFHSLRPYTTNKNKIQEILDIAWKNK